MKYSKQYSKNTYQSIPKRHQRYEAVELIRPVHRQAQDNCEEVQPEDDPEVSDQAGIPGLPGVVQMSIARQEQVGGHEGPDHHVDGQDLAGTCDLVHQDDQLHPALPLVGLFTVEYS